MQGSAPEVSWQPTPKPPRPDVSIEPIPCDEPIAKAGFPPLPDRLDLPIPRGGWASAGGGGGGGSGAASWFNGGGGGGGNAGGPPQPTGVHEHYVHYEPGAFVQGQQSHYYKANTAPTFQPGITDAQADKGGGPSGGADYFAAGGKGDPPPKYTGSTGADLAKLGPEPKLSDKPGGNKTPDAPAAVNVSQAQTQDLSLPEDDFSYAKPYYQNGTTSALKNVGKSLGRSLLNPIYSVGGMTSGMTSGLMHH